MKFSNCQDADDLHTFGAVCDHTFPKFGGGVGRFGQFRILGKKTILCIDINI